MDLAEQIETVQLHARSLIDRLSCVSSLPDKARDQLGPLMLWCDRLAARCEELGKGKK